MFLSRNSQKRNTAVKRLLPFIVLALLSLQVAAFEHLHLSGESAACHLCVNGLDAPLVTSLGAPSIPTTFSPRPSFGECASRYGAIELPRVRGPPADS
jgi:hypothetical protein